MQNHLNPTTARATCRSLPSPSHQDHIPGSLLDSCSFQAAWSNSFTPSMVPQCSSCTPRNLPLWELLVHSLLLWGRQSSPGSGVSAGATLPHRTSPRGTPLSHHTRRDKMSPLDINPHGQGGPWTPTPHPRGTAPLAEGWGRHRTELLEGWKRCPGKGL